MKAQRYEYFAYEIAQINFFIVLLPKKGTIVTNTNTHAIEVSHLSKQYKGASKYALTDVSFTVERGEVYGVLGPNGAGKTTLMSILFGSIRPTEGSFSICNLTYAAQAGQLRYKIGVVPQEYALYPTLTARENLLYFGSLYALKGNALKQKVDEGLARVQLLEVADRKIATFSGGMKRRVNLLAGILHTPEVLFLDEPTVGVDVLSKRIIINYLKELNGEGMSVLYTSHHLQEAQDFCHKVAFLNGGRLIAEGSPEALIEQYKSTDLEAVFVELAGGD